MSKKHMTLLQLCLFFCTLPVIGEIIDNPLEIVLPNNKVEVAFAKKDFSTADCTLQEEEVSDIRMVDGDEVLRIERDERKRGPEYMALLQAAMAKYTKRDF